MKRGIKMLIGVLIGIFALLITPFIIPVLVFITHNTGNFGTLLLLLAVLMLVLSPITMVCIPIYLIFKRRKNRLNTDEKVIL